MVLHGLRLGVQFRAWMYANCGRGSGFRRSSASMIDKPIGKLKGTKHMI